MTKSLRKNLRRSISGSLGRYLAILLIIALGVAFLAGLRLTRPVMSATATAYIQQHKMYDLRLLSTVGFDEDDVAAARGVAGVSQAEGSYSADFVCLTDGGEQVLRTHLLTETLDLPELTAGRMPQTGSECLADAERFGEDAIGQTLTVADAGEDSILRYTQYTITGLAHVPYYLNRERGTTTMGDGSLDGFLLLTADGYDSEYYTELYVQSDTDFALYSAEYDDFIDTLSAAVEDAVTPTVNARYDTLLADAQQEIDDGQAELDTQRADAQAELDDARAQLDDAQAELDDGEQQLAEAKQTLDDARARLDSAAAQLQPGYTSWQGALDAGWAQYNSGTAQLNSALAQAQATLNESKAQLDSGEAQYADGLAQYNAGKAQYDAGKAQYDAGKAEYDKAEAQYAQLSTQYESWVQGTAQYQTALADYQKAYAALTALPEAQRPANYDEQMAALAETKQQLDQTQAGLDQLETGLKAATGLPDQADLTDQTTGIPALLAATRATLDDTAATLQQTAATLQASADTLQASADALAQSRAQLDEGWAQYNSGTAQLESQRTTQQAALASAYSGLTQFQQGIDSYYQGLADYREAARRLDEGRTDYADGLAEYEDALAEFDDKIADAEAELADAQATLADLADPELYVLDRTANTGFVSFNGDSQIVENLSTLFPIFFFLIAALVCSTTMARMIDEDRAQIGTLRAMGYSRAAILAKYLLYSGSAALAGCLLGYFGGGFVFPYVIWYAYGMLYDIPGFIGQYSLPLFLTALVASLLCSAGVTFVTCRREMASTPAALIRPKSPAAGKRILLERCTPLWSRLKFLYKVTLRNIFRFKKRMVMMLLGIAGCTALVLTGFGIRDSVANIGNYQFDDIQRYDVSITLSDPAEDQQVQALTAPCADQLEAQAVAEMASGELTGPLATKTVYFVVSDDAAITQIFDLHRNGQTVAWPGAGQVVITEKLAELTGVSVGDTITLAASDTDAATLTVSGIVENYVQNYVYLTGESYSAAFTADYAPKTLLLRLTPEADDYAVAATLAGADGVTTVSVIADTRQMVENMMQSLNYVVALILFCAGALAFIVLFNLGNINLTERVREIATIKVLGFHRRETGAYVFRENFLLSGMGILLGLPLGVALHAFVMAQIKVDLVSFKLIIQPVSYLLTVGMVLLFAFLTDLIMRRKIDRIDMAESLKSVE